MNLYTLLTLWKKNLICQIKFKINHTVYQLKTNFVLVQLPLPLQGDHLLFLLLLHHLLHLLQGVRRLDLLNQLLPVLLALVHGVLHRPAADHLLQGDGRYLHLFAHLWLLRCWKFYGENLKWERKFQVFVKSLFLNLYFLNFCRSLEDM